MSSVIESKVRIQKENSSVSDEIEAMKKVSRNIGGIVTFLGTGRELSKGENITQLNFFGKVGLRIELQRSDVQGLSGTGFGENT